MKAYVGMMVVVRDQDSNGTREHPAVVNRAWSSNAELGAPGAYNCVNLTVFPDMRPPYSLGSVYIHDRDYGQERACWPASPPDVVLAQA